MNNDDGIFRDDQCNHVPQDTTINDENLLQMSSSIDDNQIQMVLSEVRSMMIRRKPIEYVD